ncbi:MAG: hypothetical protein IKE23_01370 [Exiguobacterium sp.]|nr:hypothetical protein [Exiguobacterium sp.]
MTDWANYYKREENKSSKKVQGQLRCVITSAEEAKSKTGKDMIVVSVKPSGAEFSVKHYIVKNEYFNRNMTVFFDSFPAINDGDFEFLHWVGCEGAANFVEDENGYTKIRWFIEASRAKDLPPFEGTKPEKIEVNNDFSDINEDDLPF